MSIPKTILFKDYLENSLTTRQIAEKHKVGATTVKRLLRKYNIKPRHEKRIRKGASILTKEYLEEHYVLLGKTCKQIGEELGLSAGTVSSNINRHKIPKRIGTRKGCRTKKIHKPKYDLSGKIFYDLTIMEYVRGGWLCKCKCGQTKIIQSRRFTEGNIRSCGCRVKSAKGSDHHLWKGCGEISNSFYKSYYNGAIDRNIEFDISIEYLWDLFIKQDKKCNISNIELILDKKNRTASLDRIDSSKGYIENNVQWVHKIVNKIKWDLKQEDFIEWCKIIAAAN